MLFGPKFANLIITDTAIKVVAAKPTTTGFKISFLGKKNLPQGIVFNGRVVNTDLFREALKTFFLENYEKLRTRNLVVGINEQEIFIDYINFEKKPNHLDSEINSRLAENLPFDPNEAIVLREKLTDLSCQLIATKKSYLQTIVNIIEDANFTIKALVPIPMIFPKLVKPKTTPYLFISSEDDLIFSLVINGIVIFSSTFILKKPLQDSEKEVVMMAEEIIRNEYQKVSSEPLKNVFIFGRNSNYLNKFFVTRGFLVKILYDSTVASKQTGYDFADYSRAIALSYWDSSLVSFPKLETPKNIAQQPKQPAKKRSNLIFFLLPLILLTILAAFFIWPIVKSSFFQGNEAGEKPKITKEVTSSASKNIKKATPEAKKNEAAPTAEPAPTVNRADYKIRILNGSGKTGAANQARDFLVGKGYVVESTGNASNYNYQKTLVQVKDSQKEVTDLLTKDLQERYAINVGSPLSEGESCDILIIVGGE